MDRCPDCGSERAGRCRNCKRVAYHRDLGRALARCSNGELVPASRLTSTGECRRCLAARGLRECAACRQVLIELLAFTAKQRVCSACRSRLRRRVR